MTPRTLSKSDFKLARSCDAKLFFRENGYPDNRDSNPYLVLLAEGGYMVEALAKAKYVDGVQLEYGGGVAEDYRRTIDQLGRDQVTLFEATLLVGRQQARVDILEKKGNTVRLLEVKAKSFDGAEHALSLSNGKAGALRGKNKPYKILNDWEEKLEDITFQVLLLEKTLPGVVIKPFLVLVDKSKTALVDNIPSLFELVHRTSADGARRLLTARYIGSPEQLAELDLVTEVDVSAEVAMLRDDVEEAAAIFESRLDAPLSVHSVGIERGSKCGSCEFRVEEGAEKNGFDGCWGALAAPRPVHARALLDRHVQRHSTALRSWIGCSASRKRPCLKSRKTASSKLTVPSARTRSGNAGKSNTPGAARFSFLLISVVSSKNFRGGCTSSTSRPRASRCPTTTERPYGLVAFQWSCHTVASHGLEPTHAEWLNKTDVWPNKLFAESLRGAIGDSGPVLTWSHFEGTTIKQIMPELVRFGHDVPELIEWMTDVVENRIVDMHDWAKNDYYHPGMRGRTSIKVVLDALWKSDGAMPQAVRGVDGHGRGRITRSLRFPSTRRNQRRVAGRPRGHRRDARLPGNDVRCRQERSREEGYVGRVAPAILCARYPQHGANSRALEAVRRTRMTPTKQERYRALVERKAYNPERFGLANPSAPEFRKYDSDEIGPWTRWANDLDADLMVVGQDWGDNRYFLANEGLDKTGNPTNASLRELLEFVGRPVPPPSSGEPGGESAKGVWLTNALLWLKKGGMSAAVKPEWFKEPAADFLREQINIVEPRVVVGLGARAYSAIAFAFGITTPRGIFRKIVEDTAGVRLRTPFECTLFGVYHCGSRITGMTRSRAEQRKDWMKIRDALARKKADLAACE